MTVLSKIKTTVECRLISFLLSASKITFIFFSSLESESELSAIQEKLKILEFINSNHTNAQSFAKNFWKEPRLCMEFKDSRITQTLAYVSFFLIVFWLRNKISDPKGWILSKLYILSSIITKKKSHNQGTDVYFHVIFTSLIIKMNL